VTTSGISAETPFRCLAIIRRDDPPSGPVTDQMMENFRESGGRLLSPTDDDLRSLAALQQLDARDGESFGDWLRQRRPISSLPLFEQLIRDFLADPAA